MARLMPAPVTRPCRRAPPPRRKRYVRFSVTLTSRTQTYGVVAPSGHVEIGVGPPLTFDGRRAAEAVGAPVGVNSPDGVGRLDAVGVAVLDARTVSGARPLPFLRTPLPP